MTLGIKGVRIFLGGRRECLLNYVGWLLVTVPEY